MLTKNKEKNNEKRIPTLICLPTTSKQVQAWCPNCKKFHFHGLGKPYPKSGNLGHRVAHCGDGGYLDTGYFLKLLPKAVLNEANRFLRINK